MDVLTVDAWFWATFPNHFCLVPSLTQKYRWQQLSSTDVWREQNPVGSQSFIKSPVSCVSVTFVFLFYSYSPANLWHLSTRRHLNRRFVPLLLRLFRWIWFLFENKQKARATHTLRGELLFQLSRRPAITGHLSNFVIQLARVITADDEVCVLLEWAQREAARSLSRARDKKAEAGTRRFLITRWCW